MPIFLASTDSELTITHVHGHDETTRHLRDMGIVVGAKVRLLSKEGRSIIMVLSGSRIALDSNLASRIMVG
ncbi:MAG: ferrous iron transport protein A [Bacilli bacterium]|nr:ferrous iron transport protein A [Bacilli bacterium]